MPQIGGARLMARKVRPFELLYTRRVIEEKSLRASQKGLRLAPLPKVGSSSLNGRLFIGYGSWILALSMAIGSKYGHSTSDLKMNLSSRLKYPHYALIWSLLPDDHTLTIVVDEHVAVHVVCNGVDVWWDLVGRRPLVQFDLLLTEVGQLLEGVHGYQHRPDVGVNPAGD